MNIFDRLSLSERRDIKVHIIRSFEKLQGGATSGIDTNSNISSGAAFEEPDENHFTFDSISQAAKAVNTSPTEGQAAAGNYSKGHVSLHGLKAVIENPKDSMRKGKNKDGKQWQSKMNAHYGYFSFTEGADGDHVDVFFGSHAEDKSPRIYIVNQNHPDTGKFDEHKVMFGYTGKRSAKKAYIGNYEKGWKGFGSIKELSLKKFKQWLFSEKTKQVLDSASISLMDRRKIKRLINKDFEKLKGDASLLERRKIKARIQESFIKLGGAADTNANTKDENINLTPASEHYANTVELSFRKRQVANNIAIGILDRINTGELKAERLTDDQKSQLASYTGNGGGLTGADGKTGSPYEYYTPKPLAEATWGLLKAAGFSGGSVLDPSSGTGIFGATGPANAIIDAVELDETSGGINKALNSGNGDVKISSFEAIASQVPDGIYDAVITNIPFGSNLSRGGNQFKDSKYQKESLEAYFVLRSLEKLKYGGVAAFISSSKLVSGQSLEKVRLKISEMAEFMGAFRLPNAQDTGQKTKKGNAKEKSTFAGADVTSDVLVFKKHSKDATDKIQELKQSDALALIKSNILWQPFISGKYFSLSVNKEKIFGNTVLAKNKFGKDVERVVSDSSISSIAKLMTKLDDSRINWQAFELQAPEIIEYQEGDIKYVGGEPYIYKKGVFEKEDSKGFSKDTSLMISLSKLHTPLLAIEQNLTREEAFDTVDGMYDLGRHNEVPQWITRVKSTVAIGVDSYADDAFHLCLTALSVEYVFNEHSHSLPFNFSEKYPRLTKNIKLYANKSDYLDKRAHFSIKSAFKRLKSFYTHKSGFSNVWMGVGGKGLSDDVEIDEYKYENLKYSAEHVDSDGFIDIGVFKEKIGSDPFSDEWCLSPDGKGVMSASDYYTGNYSDFLTKYSDIGQDTENKELREKLVRQIDLADSRTVKVDHTKLKFNIKSPLISVRRKVEFLNKYVPNLGKGSFAAVYNEVGREIIEYKHSNAGKGDAENLAISSEEFEERKRNLKRFAQYITKGTFSTGSTTDEKKKRPKQEKARVQRLRGLVNNINQQFDSWTRANSTIQSELKSRFNNPENVFFYEDEDGSPIEIPNLSDKIGDNKLELHDYQNVAIRGYARKMKGIMGYDVGLGKTAVALSTIEYLQSRRIKKKTLTIVPNSTLSNWKKEVGMWYKSDSGCLFVGLSKGKDGKDKVVSSDYARDMMKILENNHSKVFMTLSAFEMIPLKELTWEKYIDHVRNVDRVYDDLGAKNKTDELKKRTLIASLAGASKNDSLPFFEDMGFDSLVIDEAHLFKNSKRAIEFKSAKRLSLSTESKRGTDALAKSWFIRGKSSKGDGVLPLTATPITNSPLEMYSMLSLAVGEEELNKRLGGIRGADDFLEMFTVVDETDDINLLGEAVTTRVFTGLGNVDFLRNILHGTAKIKTAKDVNLKIPDYEEISVNISLPDYTVRELKALKEIYRIAKKADSKNDVPSREEMDLLNAYMQATGETIPLIAHPFNLINKMNKSIIDEDLARQSTVFTIPEDEYELAKEVVSKFNDIRRGKKKTPITEKRGNGRKTPLQTDSAILETITGTSGDDDNEVLLDIVHVRAIFKDGRVLLDTERFENQNVFIKLAEQSGLHLNVSISPKVAAFVEKFTDEACNPKSPRNKPTMAKQIVFCDMLGMHNKIKIIIAQKCGIPSEKIFILNGQSVKDPAGMQDVQDQFNAEGDDNGYEVIIANKKAEVGINLQKGTQAIHHLTIGWTPDSQQQRNGRGVRQGNYVKGINVYHYDADGTFDNYKRELVDGKSDWISGLVSGTGSEDISVNGGISREDADELINAVGDENAIREARKNTAKRFEEVKKKANHDRVISSIELIKSQKSILKKYDNKFPKFLNEKIFELSAVIHGQEASQRTLDKAIEKGVTEKEKEGKESPRTISAIGRAENRVSSAQMTIDRMSSIIDESISVKQDSDDSAEGVDSNIVTLIKNDRFRNSKGVLQLKDLDEVTSSWVRGVRVEILEDSSIKDDWKVEIDTSKRLMSEGIKEARKLSENAGIDPSRVDGFDTGDADIVNGKIVKVGDFVIGSNNDIYIISSIRKSGNHGLMTVKEDGHESFSSNFIAMVSNGDQIVSRENSLYKSTVEGAAKKDSQIIKNSRGIKARINTTYGTPSIEASFNGYAAYNSEVANLVKNNHKDKYVIDNYSARYLELDTDYPYIINLNENGESALTRAIAEEQKKAVTINGELTYIKKNRVKDIHKSISDKDKIKRLVSFAIKNNFSISQSDSEILGTSDGYSFFGNVLAGRSIDFNTESLRDLVKNINDQDSVKKIALEMAQKAMPFYQFSGYEDLSQIDYEINNIINSRVSEIQSEKRKLVAASIAEDIAKLPVKITSNDFSFDESAAPENVSSHAVIGDERGYLLSSSLGDEQQVLELKESIDSYDNLYRLFKVSKDKMRDISHAQLLFDEKEEYESLESNSQKLQFLDEINEVVIKSRELESTLGVDSLNLEDPLEWVAIIGDTYGFHTTIKKMATEIGESTNGDDYALWCKSFKAKKRIPSPPENSWIVSRRVYNAIVKQHSDECQDRNISTAQI